MITGIAGASLWSEDNAKLVAFYRDVIGMPKPVEEGEGYVAFGDEHGPWLGIGTHSEVKGHALDPYRHMIALGTTDVKQEYERLKGKGVEFIEEPKDYGGGFWIATLKDPEGNIVQLFQTPG